MLGKALNNRADNHDQRPEHDGPPTSIAMGKPRCNWDSKDGTKLVARVDESEQARFDGICAIFVHAPLAKVYM